MNERLCGQMQLLIQASLDGELDVGAEASLGAHIAHCQDCAAVQDSFAHLSSQLRAGLTRHTAPPAVRRAVLDQIRAEARLVRPRLSWRDGGWFGAGLALAASIAAVVLVPRSGSDNTEIISGHIRALQPGHLTDVVSTDRHTVKPWFNGRLDFSPPVRDFAASGFPLVGGRLDYLGGRAVAALVYRRGKHLIDVFIWPGSADGSRQAERGYNLQSWSRDKMNFRAVSDLNASELADFAKLFSATD